MNRLYGDTLIDTKNGFKKVSELVGQKVICYDKYGKEIEITPTKEKSDKLYQYLFCSIDHYQYFTVFASRDTKWVKTNDACDYGFNNDVMKVAGEFEGSAFVLEHISARPFYIPTDTYCITTGTGDRGVRLANGLIIVENKSKPKKILENIETVADLWNVVKEANMLIRYI